MTASASPNHGDRRGQRVALVVIHATNMASCAEARARLCDPTSEVSAHWLIAEDGTTEALVPEDRRAWHAGAGAWRGEADVNSRSIGIELSNPMDRPFPEPQMAALEVLLAAILARHRLPPEAVIAHSDMAPERKDDPGPRFDWARLARQGLAAGFGGGRPGAGGGTKVGALDIGGAGDGLAAGFGRGGVRTEGAGATVEGLEAGAGGAGDGLARVGAAEGVGAASGPDLPLGPSLDALGYPPAPEAARLAAFRLRHRPFATGPETEADRCTASALL